VLRKSCRKSCRGGGTQIDLNDINIKPHPDDVYQWNVLAVAYKTNLCGVKLDDSLAADAVSREMEHQSSKNEEADIESSTVELEQRA